MMRSRGGATLTNEKGSYEAMVLEFFKDQCCELLSIFNSQNNNYVKVTGNASNTHWIIDIQASHHMTSNNSLLTILHDAVPSLVGLSNGSRTMARKIRFIMLGININLLHVLYDPQLMCNLIFVPRFIIANNYFINFIDKYCVIRITL